MVTRKNESTTAVIDPDTEEQLRAEKERRRAEDWAIIDRLRERNADKDPDEVLADVTAVVEEVRQELYEREQRQKTARRD